MSRGSPRSNYARLEADYLLKADASVLSASDRLRRMAWPAPIVVFFYVLVVKGCLFDGWPGWFYAVQRVLAECRSRWNERPSIRRKSSRTIGKAGPG